MKNLNESDLNLNLAPSQKSHRKSKSVLQIPANFSAFGSSCRKISKFDVVDPLNTNLITPGPGKYPVLETYSAKTPYKMQNLSEMETQYLTQQFYQDNSSKIVFKKKKSETSQDLNKTHQQEPAISFPKSSAERGLWEPRNYYHPYKLPDKLNPGPGSYEKTYEPVRGRVSNWFFKSSQDKFEELIPRGVGPGSYSADASRKLPDWKHFGSKAVRNCKIKLDNSVIVSPSPAAYRPYVPGINHSSTYVFNSHTKRGCQTMPAESAGPGSYNLIKDIQKPVSFSKTERDKFEYFKGKLGVGPAHYVNNKSIPNRSCSFEMYSDRFFPIDKTGVFVIPEAEDDQNKDIINENVFVKKNNKVPFNSSVDRAAKIRKTWEKKKVAPDPGFYQVKDMKKIGNWSDKSPRFRNGGNGIPGPGEYEISRSIMKPVSDKEFNIKF